MGLNGVGEFAVGEKDVSIVDVESRQFMIPHDMNLFNINFRIWSSS